MIAVNFDPTKLTGKRQVWWTKWISKARIAIDEEIAASISGEEYEFNNGIWTELKHWLSENVFHSKCAYCQSEMEVAGYATADHYRPKGKVGEEADHKGYCWIAYEWKNLLPCCAQCNSGGKGTAFPIQGTRVFSREEVTSIEQLDEIEKPLLLNAYGQGEANPRKHITFSEFGGIAARNGSVRGEATIKVCGLKREKLMTRRRQNQENALREWLILGVSGAPKEDLDRFFAKIEEGRLEHSAAVGCAIRAKAEEHLERVKNGLSEE